MVAQDAVVGMAHRDASQPRRQDRKWPAGAKAPVSRRWARAARAWLSLGGAGACSDSLAALSVAARLARSKRRADDVIAGQAGLLHWGVEGPLPQDAAPFAALGAVPRNPLHVCHNFIIAPHVGAPHGGSRAARRGVKKKRTRACTGGRRATLSHSPRKGHVTGSGGPARSSRMEGGAPDGKHDAKNGSPWGVSRTLALSSLTIVGVRPSAKRSLTRSTGRTSSGTHSL